MRHDVIDGTGKALMPVDQSFWDGLLNERARKTLSRLGAKATRLDLASEEEALAMFAQASENLTLAAEAAIRRMLQKNPNLIYIIRRDEGGPALGLFACLPLNEFGAASIANGQFDGTNPDPAWIVRNGETPVAMYEWLFFGPGLYMKTQPAVGRLYRSFSKVDCPVFSKGTTDFSARLLLSLGFIDACTVYPNAQKGFVVVLPQNNDAWSTMLKGKRTEIRQVRSFEDLAHVISIRSATYLAEQFPLYTEEFDGNDFCATHLVGYIDGDPAGAVRIRYFGDFAKVERLAVKLEYRKSRLAFQLVKAAVAHVRRKGFTRVYGHASAEIAPFWKLMGASAMENRKPFRFANIEYYEMGAELEPDPLAIKYGVAPMVTIRPEGLWDEPGALDWSNIASDPMRTELMIAGSRKSAG
jgi:predicted GNAT family N-acyltransferase